MNADSPFAKSDAAARLPVIIERLWARHPDACCALNYRSAYELLMATILSAQSTDERVNMVTPVLFERFPTVQALAAADRGEIEAIIKSVGFYRQKARFLQESAQMLVVDHGGEVPADLNALTKLPGVARKTANVVLGEIFHLAEGIVVDTHVKRLSNRLGLTTHSEPVKIETDLMAITPREHWIEISHLLIFHGRRVCDARKPDCANCSLSDLCPSAGTFD